MVRPTLALAAIALLLARPPSLDAQGIKISQSLAELEAAARKDSNDAAAHYNVALGYWSKKRWDDAERSLRLAVAIEPRFALGWLALSALPYARRSELREEAAKGKVPDEWKAPLQESGRMMHRAFMIDPLVDLKILGAVDPSRPVSIWTSRGVITLHTNPFDAFREGRYADAFAFFDGMTRRGGAPRPEDSIPAFVLWYHGLSAAHLQFYAIAIQDLLTLLARAEAREQSDSLTIPLGTNDYRYVLALLQERMNRPLEAIRLYRQALENDLGLYMAHLRLSRIYEASQTWDSAVVESRAAVVTNPEDASLLLDHGIILTLASQFVAAEDTLRRAMDANPRNARVPYFLGITEQAMQKKAEARAAFERFLSLAPSRFQRMISDAQERLAALH